MAERQICKACFYEHHTDENMVCHHSGLKEVFVKWIDHRSRWETTSKSIRPFPEALRMKVKSHVAMCNSTCNCRRDNCTFAHGEAEKQEWNMILRESSEFRNYVGACSKT